MVTFSVVSATIARASRPVVMSAPPRSREIWSPEPKTKVDRRASDRPVEAETSSTSARKATTAEDAGTNSVVLTRI